MIELKMIQKMISAIETPINFQLPPNSAIKSAARSASVKRAFASSLTLRETRERRSSSVRQPICQRAQHFECNVRTGSDEREERVARKNREVRIFDNLSISGSLPTVDERHFAE